MINILSHNVHKKSVNTVKFGFVTVILLSTHRLY